MPTFKLVRSHVHGMRHRARTRHAARGSSMQAVLIRKALVGGTSFGLGYLQGAKGGMPMLASVPYDLLAALGAGVLELSGVGGKMVATVAAGVGDAALGFYAGHLGTDYGLKHPMKSSSTTAAGALPPASGYYPAAMGQGAPQSQFGQQTLQSMAYGYRG